MDSEPADGGGREEPLAGGNVGRVWKVGETVRRETGPWSPAVHRLLAHLRGMATVPKLHGVDEHGREILDFVPGRIVDVDHELLTDAQLTAIGAWARTFHECTADFDDPGPWRFPGPPDADIIGHNDIAPYSVCFDGDELIGVFDWDLAGPTTALLELGFIAWNCVPLYRTPDVTDPDSWSADRLRVLADAYGGIDPAEILAATLTRTEYTIAAVQHAAAAGDRGMQRIMATTGEPGPTRLALKGLRARAHTIRERI